jgi:hypothetical protein
MGEPGNLPRAQKGELPGFIGARANTGSQPARSACGFSFGHEL